MPAVIVRHYAGGDLVIGPAELKALGVQPGGYVAIRPMAPVPVLEVPAVPAALPATSKPLQAWTLDAVDESDTECAYEEAWLAWSAQAG